MQRIKNEPKGRNLQQVEFKSKESKDRKTSGEALESLDISSALSECDWNGQYKVQ